MGVAIPDVVCFEKQASFSSVVTFQFSRRLHIVELTQDILRYSPYIIAAISYLHFLEWFGKIDYCSYKLSTLFSRAAGEIDYCSYILSNFIFIRVIGEVFGTIPGARDSMSKKNVIFVFSDSLLAAGSPLLFLIFYMSHLSL